MNKKALNFGKYILRGKKNPNFGKPAPNRGKHINVGKNNGMYKENAGLKAIHAFIRIRFLKPKLCQHCHKKPPRDLANKSGKYLRDLSDWEWLCRKCHMLSDGRLNSLIENYNKDFKKRGNQYTKRVDHVRGDVMSDMYEDSENVPSDDSRVYN